MGKPLPDAKNHGFAMESNEDIRTCGAADLAENSLPSCDSCRVRKLKCSRDRPLCLNCARLKLTCNYDSERSKPGLKRGTVERLTRRIETLERKLLHGEEHAGAQGSSTDSEGQLPPVGPDITQDNHSVPVSVLSVFAEGIAKLSSEVSYLSRAISLGTSTPASYSRKRHKPQNESPQRDTTEAVSSPQIEGQSDLSNLFAGEHLEHLVDAYFQYVHPWIPMIHMATFRRRMKAFPKNDPPLILYAILVGALRFVDPTGQSLTAPYIEQCVEQSRNKVILAATKDLSVDNLQALIIVAFSHIGDGEPMKAWPLIASLSRTVDFLHLSIEDNEEEQSESFLKPVPLPRPVNWIEEEERRRVFWNIFILDRICSITTGWNLGLTADNVWRRLPACGTHWNEENPVLSPFFGMWDKSAAKISNSVAFLPAHYPSPGQSTDAGGVEHEANLPTNQKLRSTTAPINMSTIGAFAYYVESLESLCRVDIYFLKQKINFNNRQEVSSWLTRFKELDLRLVHWKMFLPAKWRDPNVPPEASTALDPNMSLAHITHNTSMILLHQRIGYPEPELKAIKLPNYYSAETCQSAAMETLNIARKYLENAPIHMLLSPHFSFCLYVSARVLLVHCRYYRVDLDPQFSGLVECLHIISTRWLGSQNHSTHIPLSSQFATSLEAIHELYQRDPDFSVNVVGSLRVESSQTRRRREYEQSLTHRASHLSEANQISQSRSLPSAPLSLGVSWSKPAVGSLNESVPSNWTSPPDMTNTRISPNVTRPDDLSDILQTLTDERFMELDRVIAFDDFNFDVETERLDNTSLSGGTGWNSTMQGWSNEGPS